MLRLLVLLLAVANLGYWAWADGHLRELGLGPPVEREPERVARQLHPEALKVEPLATSSAPPRPAARAASKGAPAAAAPATAASDTPAAETTAADAALAAASAAAPAQGGSCLQVGVFDARQTEAVRIAAATLPRGSWRIDPVEVQGRWMVYIGKLADADAVATKRAEVRALGVDTDRPGPGFEPGLSLGRFSSEEAAQRALTDLARKGVRTAHVVQERGNAPAFVLRLPAADAALREQLRALRPVFAGRDVRPCS